MAFHKIDRDSINSITNALDFFQVPPTNVSISSSKVFEILTNNPLTDTPYHFKIHSSQNYIDLSKIYLFTEFQIKKEGADGKLVNLDGDNVAPIQLIGQTFINNMKISINGREIFHSNSLYAYKTYFSHELSYSMGAKNSHLNASGYYYDSDTNLEGGNGFNSRKKLFEKSKTVQFMSKLDADFLNQPLYLINHCEIDIEISPNDTRFVLIAPPKANETAPIYHFEIVSCKLYVKKVDLMDGLALDIARKLETKPARYAIRKTMMKPLFISQGRYEFNANLFMDQVPRRITLGLVANNDYVGRQDRSPFNFQHFHVREISIIANGRSYPQAPYDFDYNNAKYVRAFHDMNEAVGLTNSSENNGITYQQYGKTHCIYVFNLTNSGEDNSNTFDLIKNGTTAVNIKFNQPIPEGGAMLIVMGEADSLIMLDKNRTIARCFPCNNLPKPVEGKALIVNLDPQGYEGSHWISIYVQNKDEIIYFDSLNLPISGGNEYVKKLDEYVKITKKFNLTKVQSKFLITNLPSDPEALLAGIFQSCIDQTIEKARDEQINPDHLGCTISSQVLESDIWIPVRQITNNTLDSILNQFMKVSQSKKQESTTLVGEPFSVTVTAVKKNGLPQDISGSGRKLKHVKNKINNNNLIKIKNSDTHCLFYALVASFVYTTCSWPKWKFYNYMHSRFGQKNVLKNDTDSLMNSIGAKKGQRNYSAAEWVPLVVDHWNNKFTYQIKVFIFGENGLYKPIFKYGPETYKTSIILYHNNNHFDGVRRTGDLFGQPYCLSCETVYDRSSKHNTKCLSRCMNCLRIGPEYPCKSLDNFVNQCQDCEKLFENKNCFDYHLSSNRCKNSKKCSQCGVIWDVQINTKKGRQGHVCSETYCKICYVYHEPKRGCFIEPLILKNEKVYRIVVFDIETMQYNIINGKREHEANFIAVKITCLDCIKIKNKDECKVCGKYKTITFSIKPFTKTKVDKQHISNTPLTDFVDWILNCDYDTMVFSHFGGEI
ncbi:hypothetical protein Mgra_00004585 [Meloidogyne graminicola]|uniref:DNA-directed DNA polymerase n=1 Tax=Meloidogyne graminicola TaxID=189291 RepID=A0A8S9ZS11_9BILA|nr:hypothetical protein Mgra_00004585 [Meloidogyne graminicola]